MATAKKTATKTPIKKTAAAKKAAPAKKAVKAAAPAKAAAGPLKPIKTALNKTGLIAHLAEEAETPAGFALSYQATRELQYDGELPDGVTLNAH